MQSDMPSGFSTCDPAYVSALHAAAPESVWPVCYAYLQQALLIQKAAHAVNACDRE